MRTTLPCLAVAVAVALSTAAPGFARAQEPKATHEGESLNGKFEDPGLDVGSYIGRFESEDREVFARRGEILAACDIRPGMAVADLGAGTGAYTFAIAEKVGRGGTVYAVDIAPAFLKHLGERAGREGLSKVVRPIKGGHDATNLPPGSVDLVFLCDAYHHFEKPAAMLASIRASLRPGGRVVLVDFDKRPDSPEFVRHHARAEKEVYFKEFEAAGFERMTIEHPPALKENFVAAFRKPVRPAP